MEFRGFRRLDVLLTVVDILDQRHAGGVGGCGPQTVEANAKRSSTLKATNGTPEARAEKSRVMSEVCGTPEYRARKSRHMIDVLAKKRADNGGVLAPHFDQSTPEVRALKSGIAKRSNTTPEFRAAASAHMKRICANPGASERKSLALKAALATPEARALKSSAAKAWWVARKAADALLSPELKARKEIMRLEKYIEKLKKEARANGEDAS